MLHVREIECGVVVIGRNEGTRLARSLTSVRDYVPAVVYVDSGSTDGSITLASRYGAVPLQLDCSRPFSAARARNEGFHAIMARYPQIKYVQFVDGDCELDGEWIARAVRELSNDYGLAVICGRLNELDPSVSIFARLCDMEWNRRPGPTDYCGGIFMIRSEAFASVSGFNELLIAGEDPELCVRLRLKNWKLVRTQSQMATHDGAITRFGQWWKRVVRSGYGYAEGAAMHGRGPTRHYLRQCRSNWLWGFILPSLFLTLAWQTSGWSLVGFGLYPLQAARISHIRHREWKDPIRHALLYGVFVMLGKFPGALGQAKYWFNRIKGTRSTLIEYKTATSSQG